jgi:catechol 2,3-dioxygenase-like lactoylglutathione lyase family enzyme
MRIFCIALLLTASTSVVLAQLAPPNDAAVSLGHIHFVVSDPEAMKKAWVDVLGAAPSKAGALDLLKLPGIFIIVSKANMPPTGGTNGSVVNHIGIAVKDYADIKAKAAAAGLMWRDLGSNNDQAFATFPEGVTVEVMVVKDQATPVAFHHVHESVPDPEAGRAWYMKEFGAASGTRRNLPAAMIPGGEVDFLKAQMPAAGTKGRSLDHIGFEVKDLDATLKRLTADGVTINMPLRDMTKQIGLKIAFITDPNGTYIELTEGLAGK